MRWKEVLFESPKKYLPMFTALSSGETPPFVVNAIKMAEKVFRKEDRIVWYLRWYRINWAMNEVMDLESAFLPEDAPDMLKARDLLERYCREVGVTLQDAQMEWDQINTQMETWRHLVNTPAPELQAIVWQKQKPTALLRELQDAEQRWQASRDQELDMGDELVFLDVGKGWAWYDLETPTCSREAKAMGHCGNAGGSHDQTILSLRRRMDGNKVRPSLTFILKDDGWLGEMKGRANEKPNPKYHEAIKALLMDPRIEGIDGGGYAPENNFSLDDLGDDKWVKNLKEKKPGMRGATYLYDEWVKAGQPQNALKERIANKIRDSLKERGYSYHKLLLGEGVIRIDSWKSRDSYLDVYNSYTKMIHDFFFKELSDEIERETLMPERKAKNIAKAAANDLYEKMFDQMLPYDCEYEVNQGEYSAEISPEWKDGVLVLDMSISDYLFLFVDDEDSSTRSWGYSRIEHLDDVTQSHSDMSDFGIFEDDSLPHIEHGILKYVERVDKSYEAVRRDYAGTAKRQIPRIPSHLIHEIVHEYSHDAAQLGDSPTEHDPNQLEMDFQSPNHGKVNF